MAEIGFGHSGDMTLLKHFQIQIAVTSFLLTCLNLGCVCITGCQCDAEGSLPGGCDKQTGACRCQPGVTGARCDSCSRGYCNAFPSCKQCPSCFFYLDRQLRTTSLALERISKSLISRPGEGAPLDPLIQALEDQLNQIRSAVSFPPESVSEVKDALSQLEELR